MNERSFANLTMSGDRKWIFSFQIMLSQNRQLSFTTQSYSSLKKWTLGLNALVSNIKSLYRLSNIVVREEELKWNINFYYFSKLNAKSQKGFQV